MATTQETLSIDRNVASLKSLTLTPMGDVGIRLSMVCCDPGGSAYNVDDTITLDLKSGQSYEFKIDSNDELKSVDSGSEYHIEAFSYPEVDNLRKAPGKEIQYRTMTEKEWLQYQIDMEYADPDFVLRRRMGDSLGRDGWTLKEIVEDIAAAGGFSVKYGVLDHDVKSFTVSPESSYISAIIQAVKKFDPIIYSREGVLFILERDRQSSGGSTQGKRPRYNVRTEHGDIGDDAAIRIAGGIGEFRPDKYRGDTFTNSVTPGQIGSKLPNGVRSNDIDLALRKFYNGGVTGGVDCESTTTYNNDSDIKEENYTVWLLDVTGRKQVNILSQTIYYKWEDNGWQENRIIETLKMYEGLNWSIEKPRPVMECTYEQGEAWGMEGERWYAPLKFTGKVNGYSDDDIGILERTQSCTYSVVVAYESQCKFFDSSVIVEEPWGKDVVSSLWDAMVSGSAWKSNAGSLIMSDSSIDRDSTSFAWDGVSNCKLGKDWCKNWVWTASNGGRSTGSCSLGLTCGDAQTRGRDATCPYYTGVKRKCNSCGYRLDCKDSTVTWHEPDKITGKKAASIVLIKDLLPSFDSFSSADPETLIGWESKTRTSVDQYGYVEKTVTWKGGKGSVTSEHYYPFSEMPQTHNLELRGDTIYAESNVSEGTHDDPGYTQSESSVIEWDVGDNLLTILLESTGEIKTATVETAIEYFPMMGERYTIGGCTGWVTDWNLSVSRAGAVLSITIKDA